LPNSSLSLACNQHRSLLKYNQTTLVGGLVDSIQSLNRTKVAGEKWVRTCW